MEKQIGAWPPEETPKKTNRELFYEVAKASIGIDMSPNDIAPDSLACMESLDGVYFKAFGEHLLKPEDRLSTNRGFKAMLKDPRLIQVETPLPGDIVISPTGFSSKGSTHGHTGVRGVWTYMSNNSDTGLWSAHYSLEAWYNVFEKTLGFPVVHFRVVDNP